MFRNKVRIRVNFIGTIVFLFVFLVNPNTNADSSKQDKKEKVTVAQFGKEKFLYYLPFYIAKDLRLVLFQLHLQYLQL